MNRSVVKSGTMVTDCVKKISRHLIFTGIQIKLNTSGVVPTSHNPQVSKSARQKKAKASAPRGQESRREPSAGASPGAKLGFTLPASRRQEKKDFS